jgi:hypothetical protein
VPLGLRHSVRAAAQRCPSPARPGSLRRPGGACSAGTAIAAGAARGPDGSMGASATSHLGRALPWRRSRPSSVSACVRQTVSMAIFFYVRRTSRADTMARRARHRGLLAFPAEAPLTPSTLDQQIALAQRDELLAKLTTLRPENEKRSGQCVSLPHDSSIRSLPTRPHTAHTARRWLKHGATPPPWCAVRRWRAQCTRAISSGPSDGRQKVSGEVIARQFRNTLIFFVREC